MSGSINKRIQVAMDEAKKISANPISAYLRKLKEEEGSAGVYATVIRQCLTKHRIPEHIQEQILPNDEIYSTGEAWERWI